MYGPYIASTGAGRRAPGAGARRPGYVIYLSHSIANTPVGHCEAAASTAGRPGPLAIQNVRPLGRPIATSARAAPAVSGPPKWAFVGKARSTQKSTTGAGANIMRLCVWVCAEIIR